MGDFNFPEIDYNGFEDHAPCSLDAIKFFDMTQYLFLSQHVHDHIRFRQGQIPQYSRLHIHIWRQTNRKFGSSRQKCCLSFNYVVKANVSTFLGSKFDYHKGDYTSIIAELQCIEWDKVLDSKSCEETWRILRDKIAVLTEKHIPIRSGNVNKSEHRDKWIQRQTVKEIKDVK